MWHEAQKHFLGKIFSTSIPSFPKIKSRQALARIDIYRKTIEENFFRALSLIYPGIKILVGDECFKAIVQAFISQEKYLPRVACLDQWGEQFPKFLGGLDAMKKLFYLEDYAHYEWRKYQSTLFACVNDVLNIETLFVLDELELQKVVFQFQPHVFLIHSCFPLEKIQKIIEDVESPDLVLVPEKTFGVVFCKNFFVSSSWIDEALWKFLNILMEGKTLQNAVLQIKDQCDKFDVSKAFQFIFESSLLQSLSLEKKSDYPC